MREIALVIDGETVRLSLERHGDVWIVHRGTREYRIHVAALEPGVCLLTAGDRSYLGHAAGAGKARALHVDGRTLEYQIADAEAAPRGGRTGPGAADLSAPMPGVVTRVAVRLGDAVTPGQPLVIVEAMKMEHVVRATRAGVVRALHVRPGEQVEGGTVVAEIVPPGEGPEPAAGIPQT